jgi:hypothetical protein
MCIRLYCQGTNSSLQAYLHIDCEYEVQHPNYCKLMALEEVYMHENSCYITKFYHCWYCWI